MDAGPQIHELCEVIRTAPVFSRQCRADIQRRLVRLGERHKIGGARVRPVTKSCMVVPTAERL